MKKLLFAALALTVIGTGLVRADDLDIKIKEATQDIENTKWWKSSGIGKLCGISIGANKEELLKSGVLVETEFKENCSIYTLKKPFRTMNKVQLKFTEKDRVCFMEFFGYVEDFTVGKSEFEAVFNMIVKKFEAQLKNVYRYNEIGSADDNRELWDHDWTFKKRPDGKDWAEWQYYPEVKLALMHSSIKLIVTNGALRKHDAAIAEKTELEAKKSRLRSNDDGADVL